MLAKGQSEFKITKFALADDEVDYRLWGNSNITANQSLAIESLPIIEATPNESQLLKYKLVTLPANTTRIPVLSVGQTDIILQTAGQTYVITPQTVNYSGGNSTYGYTAILSNSDVADIYPAAHSGTDINYMPEYTNGLDARSIAVVAHKFEIKAKSQILSDGKATITIIGNETGGRVVLQLTVKQENIATRTIIL